MLAFKGRAWVQEFEGDLTSFYRLLVCFHFSPYVHIFFFSVKGKSRERNLSSAVRHREACPGEQTACLAALGRGHIYSPAA